MLLAAQPMQLAIHNHTRANVNVQLWRYSGNHWAWWTVATIAPGRSVMLSPVNRNDQYRALGPWPAPQTHAVAAPNDSWDLK